MKKIEVFDKLSNRELTADEMAEVVLSDMKLLPFIFEGVSSKNKRIKNATAKILRTVSYSYPGKLYPRFDFFIEHMNGDDTILKWLAIDTIANMAMVDKKNKIDALLPRYYELLSDKSMITAGHSIDSLGIIARYKPKQRIKITEKLMTVKNIKLGPECRNILLGKCIMAFDRYADEMDDISGMIEFAKKESRNGRPATAKKARAFIGKHDKSK